MGGEPFGHGESARVEEERIASGASASTAADLESARLSAALRLARMGCWTFDVAAGEFIFDDTYFALHRATAELVGGPRMGAERFAREFVHPDDAGLPAQAIAAALATGDPDFEFEREARILCRDGEIRDVIIWFRIEKDSAGRTVRLHGVNQDITDRNRDEAERDRLQQQLLQAQKMESVGRLAGGVAHDFNNMLQAIMGNVELALEEPGAAGILREHLLEVQRVAHRSAELTRQLLAFARQQTVSPRAVNLNDVVAGAIRMLRRLIGEDIDLTWTPGPTLWSTRVDPTQVDQVLANLLVNARDAITGAGKIMLTTMNVVLDDEYCHSRPWAAPGDYVELSVADTGVGMTPAVMARVFEPFFTTKELGKGTGLGLATVYGIVKQNQGLIDVESEAGVGTRVTVYLPRSEATAPLVIDERVSARDLGGRETVLVVEDESSILSVTQIVLERRGYRVLSVRTPAEALELARTNGETIDLLVTDLVMPEMNGKELADELCRVRPGLRTLFMSGYSISVAGTGGVLSEGVPFISKPFTSDALAEKVRAALDGRCDAPEPPAGAPEA
jgi:two-component system, cell cycle sensor histidine kinase and response regulator CckA